ncbi:hypothetical protein NCS52_00458200 [Fusarium sp. LHS14.1]|nr:hypothetical protein NCS52_00458200 [Fusarium sp. LHS14.1]
MFRSFRTSRRLSDPRHALQDIPLDASGIQLQDVRGQASMPHEFSITTLTGWNDTVDDPLIASTQEPSFTGCDAPTSPHASVHSSPAEQNQLHPNSGPATMAMLLLALYSTTFSGLWLVVAIVQPRWGPTISTTHGLSPSNATTLIALLGKTIKIVSVTVFISCIGQVLTRRAIAEKSLGTTLADITIRNWVIQPGFIFTHYQTLVVAGRNVCGVLALLALIATILYTTASEALFSPKLKYGEWETRDLTAPGHSYYGNFMDAGMHCKEGPDSATEHKTKVDNISIPAGHTILFDNVTMLATRVENEFSDVAALYERWGRIVDNVTVSIPHPGVWSASRFPDNKILQPEDLSNAGGFSIKAAVISPTLNTLCVNMDEDELAPLIYTQFPQGEKDGFEEWAKKKMPKWHNSTVVDDVFRWGSKYGRRRPVFESFPNQHCTVYNRPNPILGGVNNAGYILAHRKEPGAEYTLSQMRSWLSTDCSTHLDVFGFGQPIMRAHCGDEDDVYRYDPSLYKSLDGIEAPQLWPVMLDMWRRGVALKQLSDGEIFGFPYLITNGILVKPEYKPNGPSISETLSVLLLSVLSLAAIDTPLRHTWNHDLGFVNVNQTNVVSDFNFTETSRAGIRSQEYTSGHTENWQRLFYLVLGLNFGLNLLCLGYLIRCFGLASDITEPQNHFYLAMSSSHCSRVDGSYPKEPDKQHLKVPWRVTQSSAGGGYQFDDCNKCL